DVFGAICQVQRVLSRRGDGARRERGLEQIPGLSSLTGAFQEHMAEKRKFQAIKGTRDLLPPETELWNRVEQTAREVFGSFGFGEIRLPIFEPTELFARSIGLDTDVVSKEMYSFEDKDETSVSLRPEATASVCRSFIEHGMHALPQPV